MPSTLCLRAVHLAGILAQLDAWLPTVPRMRRDQPCGDLVRMLNRAGDMSWTSEQLRRTVRRLAPEKIVEPELLDPSPRRPSGDRLVVLVAGIASAAPDRMLQQNPSQLEWMRAHTVRRNPLPTSSARHLLQWTERLGLLGAASPPPHSVGLGRAPTAAVSGRPQGMTWRAIKFFLLLTALAVSMCLSSCGAPPLPRSPPPARR
jgi:hypothetical protein